MKKLIYKTIAELNQLSKKANSTELAKINKLKTAITKKSPDNVLIELQKSDNLNKHFNYWIKQCRLKPEKITEKLKNKDRQIIEILIDMHILNEIGRAHV